MPVTLGRVKLTYRQVGMLPSAAGDAVLAQTAAILWVGYTGRAPVDTGKFRGGLYYRLDRRRYGADMVIGDTQGYAIWVEELWWPIADWFTPNRILAAAATARAAPQRATLPRQLTRLKPEGRGGTISETASRPVTVQPVKAGPTSPKGIRRPKPPRPATVARFLKTAGTAAAVLLRAEAEGDETQRNILRFLR